ncbi:sialic acid-binding Ig-like lectin 5 isoform X1 [Mesoplodon densirostris]|uniref:sialic acid-binding Ig-like lectin 5 isoform X1 n=1 Tax=Mesoplodon densirostris TaxID=48708 RepID=UPI0028DD227B|nr:sialic acid-binding Ig-like lectin 5 isoform X1 [Mesoplodon densirostris]
MLPLLLLSLLWGGSLQEERGYWLQVQESVTVQACLGVHVPCSFSYPWSSWYSYGEPFIYWFREGDDIHRSDPVATDNPGRRVKPETQGRFHLLGDPRKKSCSLNIRHARMSDTGVYFFRVEGGDVEYSYTDKKLNLQVTAPTEKPDIHFLEALESGRPTKLTCRLSLVCDGGRVFSFSWAGDALGAMDPETLHSSVLTFTPRPQDHGTNLTCRVNLPGDQVTMERTIRLNVSYAPWNLSINLSFRNVTALKTLQNSSSLLISESQALQLLCVADSNPPAQLSWFGASPALNATRISSTKILELPGFGAAEREFTCRAQNPLGSQNTSLSLSVVYPPQLLGPSCSQEDEGLHCDCSSRAQPAPSLRWRLGEGLLEGNFSSASFKVTSSSAGPWANSSLSLREGLSSGLRLSCEALNVHGAQSATVLLLPGKPASLTGVVCGALAGAGAMALLSLCVCLVSFCIVKARRKQAARRPAGADGEDPVMGIVAWGSRQKPWPDGPPDQTSSPAEDAPPSGEQQELHYASLSFHGMKSREPLDQEATNITEYSEIKTS